MNTQIQQSDMFREFSRFHTNMFLMDNKPVIFREYMDNIDF